jgi:hypothetical protein
MPRLQQQLTELLSESRIALLKLSRLFWTVDSGQMKDYISPEDRALQVLNRVFSPEYPGLAVLIFCQVNCQVAAQKSTSACN